MTAVRRESSWGRGGRAIASPSNDAYTPFRRETDRANARTGRGDSGTGVVGSASPGGSGAARAEVGDELDAGMESVGGLRTALLLGGPRRDEIGEAAARARARSFRPIGRKLRLCAETEDRVMGIARLAILHPTAGDSLPPLRHRPHARHRPGQPGAGCGRIGGIAGGVGDRRQPGRAGSAIGYRRRYGISRVRHSTRRYSGTIQAG